ncbi:MAG: DUF1549 domain-containing protein, partial [Acidobacteria bacterium]|nr:DUF1549 domain-containing protein [Acidobacteriota bacterium]
MRNTLLKATLLAFALTLASVTFLERDSAAQESDGERLFRVTIQPVLKGKCAACHDAESASGGLNLQSRASLLKGGAGGAVIIPGDAAQSRLLHALEGTHGLKPMPPGKPLDTETIKAFRQWIDAGAPWPEHNADAEKFAADDVWAFRSLKAVNAPTFTNTTMQTPIDHFILEKLREQKLTPAVAADRVTLLRRATFDLHGLPPTPEEVAAFVKDKDSTPQAFAKVIDRLLDSPRYGERWGRHWLDVVRYADTAGGSNDFERPHAWRYRDYVIRSFQQDKPYDQFMLEQLAGDELDATKTENLVATGYLRMGPWEHTAMSVEAVTRQEWLDDITHQTGVTFLAMTMNCAKCHDHKFDPIPTKDYYSLQAAFATTYFEDRPAPFLPNENYQPAVATTAQWQTRIAKNNERLQQTLAVIGAKKKDASQIKRLGSDPADIEHLELERAYRKRQELYRLASLRATPQAFSVTSSLNKEQKLEETHVLIGGTLGSNGAKVAPAAPSAPVKFDPHFGETASPLIPTKAKGRRLALAKWIAHPANPLPSRVMVNRIWQWHFGTGLVETANNFGKTGKRPSHPELLDWLARQFVESGWSVKAMHRLIMNSAAYQRASFSGDLAPAQVEPASRWLAHFPPRRLEAEELRDAM